MGPFKDSRVTPVPPTLHAFDPQIAGKIGLNIDPQGLATGDQVSWYISPASGGPYTQVATTIVHGSGLDALTLVFDSASAFYCAAKVDQAGVWSAYSNEVSAVVSAGPAPPPPPPTDVQLVNQALGITLVQGDKVNVYPPTPTTSQTVNADGSIS